MAARWDAFDYIAFVFFLTHIPITVRRAGATAAAAPRTRGRWRAQIWIDGQSLLLGTPVGDALIPPAVRELGAWYAAEFRDHLANPPVAPLWFKAITAAEMAVQLPFFFVALYAWATKGNWIRLPLIAYGAHVATTLVPIFAEQALAVGGSVTLETAQQRATIMALYSPYFFVPLLLMWRAMARAHLFDPSLKEGPLVKAKAA